MSNQTQNEVTFEQAEKLAGEIACPQEDVFGFAGTIRTNNEANLSNDAVAHLWRTACQAVALTFAESNAKVIEDFLRSPAGRHLADEVTNHSGGCNDEDVLFEATINAVSETRTRYNRNTGEPTTTLVWGNPFAKSRNWTLSN